ncbi:MAG: LuxR C-terminal-related transcriptional regulator [Chitinophagaceae bacterium]
MANTRNLIRQGIQECLEPIASDPIELNITEEEIESYIRSLPRGFSLGVNAVFLFNFSTQKFIYIEQTFKEISGFDSSELINNIVPDTFSNIFHPEQALITTKVHQACYNSLVADFVNRTDVHVTMDYAILTKTGDSRRLLSQFTPLLWKSNNLVLVGGFFTDITHLHREGQPIVNISSSQGILKSFSPFTHDLVKEGLTEFTIRELEMLKLTSNGYTNEEIAKEMNVSKATIYAHRRNILAKADFKSIPKLIEALRFKGILSSLMLCISSFSELITSQALIISLI